MSRDPIRFMYLPLGAVGFSEAVSLSSKRDIYQMRQMTSKLYQAILEGLPDHVIFMNGPEIGPERLCNNLSICIEGMDGDGAMKFLSKSGIACSTGSACHTGLDEPSHVLLAIGRYCCCSFGGSLLLGFSFPFPTLTTES